MNGLGQEAPKIGPGGPVTKDNRVLLNNLLGLDPKPVNSIKRNVGRCVEVTLTHMVEHATITDDQNNKKMVSIHQGGL